MKRLVFLLLLFVSFAAVSQPISTMPINAAASLDSVYVATIRKSGNTFVNERVLAVRIAGSLYRYEENFPGTTNNAFTVAKTPIAATITVFVNGQKIPKTFFTLTVNTVQINAGLLTFSTDTNDKIEITYQSTL